MYTFAKPLISNSIRYGFQYRLALVAPETSSSNECDHSGWKRLRTANVFAKYTQEVQKNRRMLCCGLIMY